MRLVRRRHAHGRREASPRVPRLLLVWRHGGALGRASWGPEALCGRSGLVAVPGRVALARHPQGACFRALWLHPFTRGRARGPQGPLAALPPSSFPSPRASSSARLPARSGHEVADSLLRPSFTRGLGVAAAPSSPRRGPWPRGLASIQGRGRGRAVMACAGRSRRGSRCAPSAAGVARRTGWMASAPSPRGGAERLTVHAKGTRDGQAASLLQGRSSVRCNSPAR